LYYCIETFSLLIMFFQIVITKDEYS
jgi:hypothetical protein